MYIYQDPIFSHQVFVLWIWPCSQCNEQHLGFCIHTKLHVQVTFTHGYSSSHKRLLRKELSLYSLWCHCDHEYSTGFVRRIYAELVHILPLWPVFMSAQVEVMCLWQHSWKWCVYVSTADMCGVMSAQLEVRCLCQHSWKCGVMSAQLEVMCLCQHSWKCGVMSAQLEVRCLCRHSWKCRVYVRTAGSDVFMSAQLEVWCLCQHNWKCGVHVSMTGSVLCVYCVSTITCVYGVTTVTCVYGVTTLPVCMGWQLYITCMCVWGDNQT